MGKIDFQKKKSITDNKKRIKIILRWKECYICGKRIQKNAEDINYQKRSLSLCRRSKIIVIMHGNTEVQCIPFGI